MTQHLSQLAREWDGRSLPAGAFCEPKLDGWRCLWLRDRDGKPRLWTRNGIPLEGVAHIAHELAAWEKHAGDAMFFDGELVVGEGPTTLAQTKAWCETGWKLGGNAGRLHLFDAMPYRDWLAGGTATPLWQRKARLERIGAAVAADGEHNWTWRPGSRGADEGASPVVLVDHAEAWDVDEVIEQASAIWQAGGEGVVIKSPFGGYQRNRSNAWMKCGRPWRDKLQTKRAA
jgi:ATP-dependent DNA ligase